MRLSLPQRLLPKCRSFLSAIIIINRIRNAAPRVLESMNGAATKPLKKAEDSRPLTVLPWRGGDPRNGPCAGCPAKLLLRQEEKNGISSH